MFFALEYMKQRWYNKKSFMFKNNKIQKPEKEKEKVKVREKKKEYLFTMRTKKWIKAILMFLIAIIIGLSFLAKAGIAGQWFVKIAQALIGDARLTTGIFLLCLFASGFIFLKSSKRVKGLVIFLAISITAMGVSGIASNHNLNQTHAGAIGLLSKFITNIFGLLASDIIFGAIILIGLFIFLQYVWQDLPKEEKKPAIAPPLKSTDAPNFKIKGVLEEKPEAPKGKISLFKPDDKSKSKKPEFVPVSKIAERGKYSLPPLDLLSKSETVPTSGNIKENSLIIKKTLENFGIPVEMVEVNVGPTVTQYAFKLLAFCRHQIS